MIILNMYIYLSFKLNESSLNRNVLKCDRKWMCMEKILGAYTVFQIENFYSDILWEPEEQKKKSSRPLGKHH